MFKRRKEEIAQAEARVAHHQHEADKYRRETTARLDKAANSIPRDRQWERGWGKQRASNQDTLDANLRDANALLSYAKKRLR